MSAQSCSDPDGGRQLFQVIKKVLTSLRQLQHSPNRLVGLLVGSDVVNFKYHWKEVLGSFSDLDYIDRAKSLTDEIDSLSFGYSVGWADGNMKRWLNTIEESGLAGDAEILEIGSYEGRSTNFWLRALPLSKVVCVDTWEGEYKDLNSGVHAQMDTVFARFTENTKWAQHRITMHRTMSGDYFAQNQVGHQFDLVYIDGSHHGADVIQDAINGFKALKPGGVMMFDDFLWKYYSNKNTNPWAAINFFLRLFNDELLVIRYGEQVHIQKNCD